MSSICEFYTGKNIFVTGVSGFLAKVIVEKILRSCPEVGHIYILLRPKKDQGIEKRLEEITSVSLFDILRKESAEQLKKLIPIAGDLERDNLGISDEDRKLVRENVSIVIHSAATVSFNEPLKKAVKINVEATRDILNLCREMKNLQVFAYISTCYVSGNNLRWKEELNPSKLTPEEVIQLVESSSSTYLKDKTCEIIQGHPNVYTFTKTLAEVLISEQSKKDNLPVVILRPSIILGTMNEPFPGYLGNVYGPTMLMILFCKGIYHVEYYSENCAPFIPADLVSNTVISAARKTAMDRSSGVIYNICSSATSNSIVWQSFWEIVDPVIRRNPLTSNPVRYPSMTYHKYSLLHNVHYLLAHFIPAAIYDLINILRGKKTRNLRDQLRLLRIVKIFKFYVRNSFSFPSENLPKLIDSMSERDRIEFNCDPRSIKWDRYIDDYVYGVRRYLLKKPDETIAEDRMKIERLKPLHVFVKYSFLLLIVLVATKLIYNVLTLVF